MDMVLHDVLVDPGDGRASDPVLADAEDAVHPRVPTDGTVIGIVLDVEADQGGSEANRHAHRPPIIKAVNYVHNSFFLAAQQSFLTSRVYDSACRLQVQWRRPGGAPP